MRLKGRQVALSALGLLLCIKTATARPRRYDGCGSRSFAVTITVTACRYDVCHRLTLRRLSPLDAMTTAPIMVGRFRRMGDRIARVHTKSLGSPCHSSACSGAAPETGCHFASLDFLVASDHLATVASLLAVVMSATYACRYYDYYRCLLF